MTEDTRVRTEKLSGKQLELLRQSAVNGDFYRADGRCLCSKCGLEYRRHPYWNDVPTFHLICNGDVVKT